MEANQGCPWCRDEVVWREVFGMLDGLKASVKKANEPQSLAGLMTFWQEFEMTRTRSDVIRFARDMICDDTLAKTISEATSKNKNWLRDSSGLWIRFLALIEGGELSVAEVHRKRMEAAVDAALDHFEKDGGGAPAHGGAMYSQLAVAYLCAEFSGTSTHTIIPRIQRVGHCCVRLHSGHKKNLVDHCQMMYVTALSETVWGGRHADPMYKTFFT